MSVWRGAGDPVARHSRTTPFPSLPTQVPIEKQEAVAVWFVASSRHQVCHRPTWTHSSRSLGTPLAPTFIPCSFLPRRTEPQEFTKCPVLNRKLQQSFVNVGGFGGWRFASIYRPQGGAQTPADHVSLEIRLRSSELTTVVPTVQQENLPKLF